MSQRIEWASGGLLDYTVNPGEWVDGHGSRNNGVAVWVGDSDGTIIEFPSKEFAIENLRAMAEAIEATRDTSRYDVCRWCEAQIVLVPEVMGDGLDTWVHVGEIGAQTPTTCDINGPEKVISPAHRFVDDEPTCRDCGTAREDEEGTVCVPTDPYPVDDIADETDDETDDETE